MMTPEKLAARHQATRHLFGLFEYEHLTDQDLRQTSAFCHTLAETMIELHRDGAELSAGLRHLLEAKDCFVRQRMIDKRRES